MLKTKTCIKCGEIKADNEFHKNKTTKDGLAYWCKTCTSEYKKQHYQKNQDKLLEYQKQYYEKNAEERKKYAKQYRQENKEKVYEVKREWYERNKEKVLESQKQYRNENKEKIAKRKKKYAEENKEHIAKYQKRYRIKNKEKLAKYIKEYGKKYYKENPHVQNIFRQKRIAMKHRLPCTLTPKQWTSIKEDFNNQCAYCGMTEEEHLKEFGEQLHQEHFIPLSEGGEYTHNNIIPACRSCNSSKNNSDFFEWYPQQEFYSKEKKKKILEYLNYKDERVQQLSIL